MHGEEALPILDPGATRHHNGDTRPGSLLSFQSWRRAIDKPRRPSPGKAGACGSQRYHPW